MEEKEPLDINEKIDQENLEKERLEKEQIEKERLEKERIENERLEQERLERERQEQFNKLNRLIPNNMIFIIPSWGDLLGYPTLGKYVGHDVAKIITDIVIFFGGTECAVETEKGTIYFIFGLGYYYTKFELPLDVEMSRGKYIIDNRLLTGLILSDFVYDHLSTSKDLTLEDDKDVVIAEKVIKIPIDLSFKSEGRQTLIKGAIMRNIFIPHKDIFLEFMEKIRDPENFKLNTKGHLILSACRDFYNKIIVSDKMKVYVSSGYMEETAGLDDINYGLDEYLPKVLSPIELQKIEHTITHLKKIYAALEFDPMYPYSILENVSKILKSEMTPISLIETSSTSTLPLKKSILFSGMSRLNSKFEWPAEFPRKIKKEIEIKPAKEEVAAVQYGERYDYQVDLSKIKDYRESQREEEQFELRVEKSENVAAKPLPPVPTEDIEQILLYVKGIIEQNFDMPSVGRALGLARDSIKNLHPVEYSTIKWELSKWANIYEKREALHGLPLKDKKELLEGVGKWINKFEEERLERERKAREERERLERERLEKERREREMIEKERIEKERQKLEEERREREKLAELREEQEQIRIQREQERIEAEKQEQLRLEQERLEKERLEREAIEKAKIELKELKAKKKQQAKLVKQKRKQEKKLEKQKAKLAKKKAKEEKELARLTEEYESMEK